MFMYIFDDQKALFVKPKVFELRLDSYGRTVTSELT